MGETDGHFLLHYYGAIYITLFHLDGNRMIYKLFFLQVARSCM